MLRWVRYQLRRVRRRIVRSRRDPNKATHLPLDPIVLARHLEGSGIRWRITGMRAFNDFVGFQLREPKDLDVQIARDDAAKILTALPSWQHYYVDCGAGLRWRGRPLPDDIRRIVSRPSRNAPWCVEWLLTALDDDEWVYWYDHRIRVRWTQSTDVDASGIAWSPPEIALLYKSRWLRAKDSADFEALLPHLNAERRAWLADAIALNDPDHVWLAELRPRESTRA